MESTTADATSHPDCAGTPQWRRGYAGTLGDDSWFGHCNVAATRVPLPIDWEFVTYKTTHEITELCSSPGTAATSIWVGKACGANPSDGYLWDKVSTPEWTSLTCGPQISIFYRNGVLPSNAFVDEYIGASCTTGPTQVSSVPPNDSTVSATSQTFNSYDEAAMTTFCNSFPAGEKCCTDDAQGTSVNVANVCYFNNFDTIRLSKGSCQQLGSCTFMGGAIAKGNPNNSGRGHVIDIGVGACKGSGACHSIAESSSVPNTPNSNDFLSITIGDNSCVGTNPCLDIGKQLGKAILIHSDSCTANSACVGIGESNGRSIEIASGQCVTPNSCQYCQSGSEAIAITDTAMSC